jgi:hypothetical protein
VLGRVDSENFRELSFVAGLVGSKFRIAGVAELADALDSKSSDRKIVWVRAPPPAVRFLDKLDFSMRRIAETWRAASGSSFMIAVRMLN